jgi:hypothetical protein
MRRVSQTALLVLVSLLHLPGIVLVVVLVRALIEADRRDGPELVPVRDPAGPKLEPQQGWRWQRRGRRLPRSGASRRRTRARA